MSVLSKLMTVTSVFAVVRVAGEAVDNKPAEGGDAAAAEAATTAAADDEAAAGEAAAPAPTDFAAGSVHALKKENFSVFLEKNKSGSLVEFYAPWCGHCKQLEPEFNKAAETMAADDSLKQYLLAKVDCTDGDNAELAQTYEIQGYPTLKWFVEGEPSEYDGPREADGIVAWIKANTGPAVDTENSPSESDKLYVLFEATEPSEAFENFAKKNRKAANFYYKKTESGAAKVTLKHKGETEIVAAADVSSNEEKLSEFMKENKFPLFGALDGDTFASYIERGNGLVWALFKMTKEDATETVEKNRAQFTELAKSLGSDFSVTHTNTEEFAKVIEAMFGITEFPKMVVQKKAGDKRSFIYDGDLSDSEALKKYIADVQADVVKPHLKSEVPPEEPQTEPVKIMTGKTMESMLFNDQKDTLLEVYAPWCGHCKKMEPEYIKVGKKVQKEQMEDIITIAKMDGTQNDSPVDEVSWSGFPTMYYVKAGSKPSEALKYDGGRDAKGMWKYIKKNHSKAEELKQRLIANKEARENKKDDASSDAAASEKDEAEKKEAKKEEL